MKISEETISILRNFSAINKSIIIYPGNIIRTRSEDADMVSEYKSPDVFEDVLSIYDLTRFLNSIKILGTDLDLVFDDTEAVTLNNGSGQTIRYGMTPESMIVKMNKSVPDFDSVLSFNMSKDDITRINNAASALSVEHLSISSDENTIIARVHQLSGEGAGSNRTDDYFDFVIGGYNGEATFDFVFDINSLPSYPGDYKVDVSDSTISKFQHTTVDLLYWTSMRDETTYSGD